MVNPQNPELSTFKLTIYFFIFYWRSIFLIVWPLALLPIVLGNETPEENAKFRCIYCILLMVGYWVAECLSPAYIGLMLIFLFPFINVLDSATIIKYYFYEVNIMVIGSLCIAVAIEEYHLHTRIALLILINVGCEPAKLLLGLMMTTACISAFLNNTVCTAMMVPIVRAIIISLEEKGIGSFFNPQTEEEIRDNVLPTPTSSTIAYFVVIAYTSTSGGLITVVGSGTVLSYKALLEKSYEGLGDAIPFLAWSGHNIPCVFIMNAILWLWLMVVYLGYFRPNSKAYEMTKYARDNSYIVKATLREHYATLGPWSWAEIWIGLIFLTVVILWFMLDPKIFPGWAQLFVLKYVKKNMKTKIITNSVPVLAGLLLLFFIPAKREYCQVCQTDSAIRPKKVIFLANWPEMVSKMAWSLVFMIGGGVGLTTAGKQTGMTKWIGEKLKENLKNVDKFIILAVLSLSASICTEFTSNMALINLFMPIIFSVSESLRINPLYLAHPCALGCNHAFLLPVGTPPNAIVSGVANIPTKDLMIAGCVMKLASYLMLLTYPFWGALFFDIEGFPAWAQNFKAANETKKTIDCSLA